MRWAMLPLAHSGNRALSAGKRVSRWKASRFRVSHNGCYGIGAGQ